jgi:hypothetical protein
MSTRKYPCGVPSSTCAPREAATSPVRRLPAVHTHAAQACACVYVLCAVRARVCVCCARACVCVCCVLCGALRVAMPAWAKRASGRLRSRRCSWTAMGSFLPQGQPPYRHAATRRIDCQLHARLCANGLHHACRPIQAAKRAITIIHAANCEYPRPLIAWLLVQGYWGTHPSPACRMRRVRSTEPRARAPPRRAPRTYTRVFVRARIGA